MMTALCIWSMMGLPALAAEGKRVAFVVGIGTYDNLSADKQLRNAVNDAEGVSAKLTEIGFQVTKAPNLIRSSFNVNWQNILDTLTKDDTLVLYFSGHGIHITGQNYLLPRDIPYIEYGRDEQLIREAISLNELLADLTSGDRPHPKRSIVILDACRDNPLIPPGYKSSSTPSGLAGLPDPDGIFVIYAAASNRTALDRLSPRDNAKYSVFTRALLPLIGRRDLSSQELSYELKDQVLKLAESVGREQRPTYYDGLRGRFCLPGCVDQAKADTKVEKELLELKERLKPRRLTTAQRTTLVSYWSKANKGDISIDFMAADGESEMFARDIAESLRISGWTVNRVGPLIPFGISTPIGLRLLVRDRETPEVKSLIYGFDHIGMTGEVVIEPKANPPIQLWVGTKP